MKLIFATKIIAYSCSSVALPWLLSVAPPRLLLHTHILIVRDLLVLLCSNIEPAIFIWVKMVGQSWFLKCQLFFSTQTLLTVFSWYRKHNSFQQLHSAHQFSMGRASNWQQQKKFAQNIQSKQHYHHLVNVWAHFYYQLFNYLYYLPLHLIYICHLFICAI